MEFDEKKGTENVTNVTGKSDIWEEESPKSNIESNESNISGAEVEKETAQKPPLLKRFWKEWGDVVILLAVVFVLFKFILQLAWVPTGSMETNIPAKSLQICWQLPYKLGDPLPKHGDVITFWSDECNEVLVKRAIGLPGDTVSISGGYVFLNGEPLDESYLPAQGITESPEPSFTVPEGCVFFMGDNRTGSFDARFWANHYIPVSQLQAKALLTISVGRNHSWTGIRFITK